MTREDRRELEHNIKELEGKVDSRLSFNPAANVDKLTKELRRLRRMRE